MNDTADRPTRGMDVIDNGGYLIGTVERVEADLFVVQKGFFVPQSHNVPVSAIDHIRHDTVTLLISREQALHTAPGYDWADHTDHGEIVPEIGDVERSMTPGGISGKSV